MTNQTVIYELDNLKTLNNEQYDRCWDAALTRVRKRIGNHPQRRDFERELGPTWTVLDPIALVMFSAALIVSSVHIIAHMGRLASGSYGTQAQSVNGTFIGLDLYAAAHQRGMIFMAEESMILFVTLFALTRKTWRRWVFLLALVAAVFVIVANWQSSVGTLEAIMPAIFTLGLNLERLLAAMLKRREEVTARYLAALAAWEAASQDATKRPDYLPFLRQEIWQKLASLKANPTFVDAPPALKLAAVNRELRRDLWVYADGTPPPILPASSNGAQNAQGVTTAHPLPTSGNSPV